MCSSASRWSLSVTLALSLSTARSPSRKITIKFLESLRSPLPSKSKMPTAHLLSSTILMPLLGASLTRRNLEMLWKPSQSSLCMSQEPTTICSRESSLTTTEFSQRKTSKRITALTCVMLLVTHPWRLPPPAPTRLLVWLNWLSSANSTM